MMPLTRRAPCLFEAGATGKVRQYHASPTHFLIVKSEHIALVECALCSAVHALEHIVRQFCDKLLDFRPEAHVYVDEL